MRTRCLETGVVRERVGTRGVGRYLWAAWRDETLPVNAFVVEHPSGLLLFDTGQTARAARSGYFPLWHPYFRLARFELTPEDEAAAQLRRLGLEPAAVRWVVLSHLHTDHVGNLNAFRGADVLVSRVEWERARGLRGRLRGYLPQHWPETLKPTVLELDEGGFGPFPGAYDVAQDGTLVVVGTPGHTPGHLSLLVRRPGGDLLLSGDLSHSRARSGVAAEDVERYCQDHDIDVVGSHDDCAAAGFLGQTV